MYFSMGRFSLDLNLYVSRPITFSAHDKSGQTITLLPESRTHVVEQFITYSLDTTQAAVIRLMTSTRYDITI